jgi:cellulose synthase/poly-beta-1,6-N-acetylglucosamine synthase-like glycosyltransferase
MIHKNIILVIMILIVLPLVYCANSSELPPESSTSSTSLSTTTIISTTTMNKNSITTTTLAEEEEAAEKNTLDYAMYGVIGLMIISGGYIAYRFLKGRKKPKIEEKENVNFSLERLNAYIKECRNKGFSDENIQKRLLAAGYERQEFILLFEKKN